MSPTNRRQRLPRTRFGHGLLNELKVVFHRNPPQAGNAGEMRNSIVPPRHLSEIRITRCALQRVANHMADGKYTHAGSGPLSVA